MKRMVTKGLDPGVAVDPVHDLTVHIIQIRVVDNVLDPSYLVKDTGIWINIIKKIFSLYLFGVMLFFKI